MTVYIVRGFPISRAWRLIRNLYGDASYLVGWLSYFLRSIRAPFGGVAGFDPILFAALVLVGVLVTHGRQLTDDPRRGVSVEIRTIRDDLRVLVGQELRCAVHVLEPDRTRQVSPLVGLL